MKKITLTAVVALVMVIGAVSPVLAKNDRPDLSLKQEVKDQRQNFRDEIASRSQQFKQMIKDKLAEARKNRVTNWWNNSAKRLQSLIDRETKLADKLQIRLDKLAANGKDVTKPRADLANTRIAITNAQNALNDAKNQVAGIVANNTPADALKKLHDLHQGVVDKIRQAQRQLTQTIASTRGASNTPTPTPTATQ